MIAVGTDDQGQVAPCRLQVFEYSEETRYCTVLCLFILYCDQWWSVY